MSKVNLCLAESIAKVTSEWEDCRERIGKLCLPEWIKRGDWMAAHMMDEYIMVNTPITLKVCDLDAQNQTILFRALEQFNDSFHFEVEY